MVISPRLRARGRCVEQRKLSSSPFMPKVFGEKLYSSVAKERGKGWNANWWSVIYFYWKVAVACTGGGGGGACRYRGTADEFLCAAQFFNMHLTQLGQLDNSAGAYFVIWCCVSASRWRGKRFVPSTCRALWENCVAFYYRRNGWRKKYTHSPKTID